MARAGSRGLEIHLGLVSIVALLGITLGCIFGAFYLGYYTGRTVGFSVARDAALADVAKLPVPSEMSDRNEAEPAKVAQIYDRLNEPARLPAAEPTRSDPKGSSGKKDERVAKNKEPERTGEPTQTSANAVNEEFEKQGLSDNDAAATDFESVESLPTDSEPQVRVLGGKGAVEKEESERTLGMLLDERLRENRKDSDKDKKDGSKNPLEKAEVSVATPTSAAVATPQPKPTKSAAVTPTPKPTATVAPIKTPRENARSEESEKGAMVRSVLPTGWFAQVAAPKKLSEAEVLVQKLRKAGFAVVVESANVRGEQYYRVVVGPESSKVQADRLVEQLKRESSIAGNPFVRRVR